MFKSLGWPYVLFLSAKYLATNMPDHKGGIQWNCQRLSETAKGCLFPSVKVLNYLTTSTPNSNKSEVQLPYIFHEIWGWQTSSFFKFWGRESLGEKEDHSLPCMWPTRVWSPYCRPSPRGYFWAQSQEWLPGPPLNVHKHPHILMKFNDPWPRSAPYSHHYHPSQGGSGQVHHPNSFPLLTPVWSALLGEISTQFYHFRRGWEHHALFQVAPFPQCFAVHSFCRVDQQFLL